MSKQKVYTFHACTQRYRRWTDAEKEEMRASFEAHGFNPKFPIALDEKGLIVDGVNRYLLCKDMGIEPVFAKVPRAYTPEEYSEIANGARRHLTGEEQAKNRHERIERILAATSNGVPIRTIAKDENMDPKQVQRELQKVVDNDHKADTEGSKSRKAVNVWTGGVVELVPELNGVHLSPKFIPKIAELSKAKQKDFARLVAKYGDIRKCYEMVLDQREPGDEDEKTEEPKLPKSVANAMADTWHAECAAALASMRKQVKTNINWSEWLAKEVLDHLKAAEQYFLAAVPRKLCDHCKGFQSVGKLKCTRCRGCGYLASQA